MARARLSGQWHDHFAHLAVALGASSAGIPSSLSREARGGHAIRPRHDRTSWPRYRADEWDAEGLSVAWSSRICSGSCIPGPLLDVRHVSHGGVGWFCGGTSSVVRPQYLEVETNGREGI